MSLGWRDPNRIEDKREPSEEEFECECGEPCMEEGGACVSCEREREEYENERDMLRYHGDW